jgi:hypothetical protein
LATPLSILRFAVAAAAVQRWQLLAVQAAVMAATQIRVLHILALQRLR